MRVIFDLDGTLALIEHRKHFIEGQVKDWKAFNEACDKDEPNFPVIAILNSLKMNFYKIYILTGRSDEVRQKTIDWLENYDCLYDELIMRPKEDFTPDHILKEVWIREIGIHDIAMAFDDRDSVVKMIRSLDIPCMQVASGDF